MRIKFWLKTLKGKYHSEELSGDGRTILKLIFDKNGLGSGLI
jgi:hypothetical protein